MKRFLILAALLGGLLATGLSNTATAYCPSYCCGGRYSCGCYAFWYLYPNYNVCRCPGGIYSGGYSGSYKGPSVIVPTSGRGYGGGGGMYSTNGMFSGRDVGAWGY